MTNLRESAKAYEPQTTRNVAELEAISLETPIEDRTGKDKDEIKFLEELKIQNGGDISNDTDFTSQDINKRLEELKSQMEKT